MIRSVRRWASLLLPVGIAVVPFACGGKVVDDGAAGDAGVDAPSPTTTTTTTPPPPPPSCPPTPPIPGGACSSGLSCTYPCVGASRTRAYCSSGRWSVTSTTDCGEPPPPPSGGMVGKACMSDGECDRTGDGVEYCGATAFTLGPMSPVPTCIETDCPPSTTESPAFCGGGENGLCLRTSGSGVGLCLGACRFDASGAPPTGCLGKDACHPYAWRLGPSGAWEGFGFCIGGCKVDADCPVGSRCQFDGGYCVKKVNPYPKKQDEPCKPSEAGPSDWSCNCLSDPKLGVGYCANTCTVGVDACTPGHLCDPMLPTSFSIASKGLTGACLKTCATNAECPTGTVCLQSGGLPQKTCQPANRL